MKKIVPFKKEIVFKTNLSEITSISLEHNLQKKDNNIINGNFVVSGNYKVNETSINTERFSYELPFDINVDEKYMLDNVVIDIDDFYYEIINNKSLEVNIDVLIDHLEEKPLIEEKEIIKEEKEDVSNIMEIEKEDEDIMERCIEAEDILSSLEEKDEKENENVIRDDKKIEVVEQKSVTKINSLFDNLDSSTETYKTYKVCIMRAGDTIESVLQKYTITKEELEIYNNLSDIKIGDKLIIPSLNNEKI